jgi:hypothetical protein
VSVADDSAALDISQQYDFVSSTIVTPDESRIVYLRKVLLRGRRVVNLQRCRSEFIRGLARENTEGWGCVRNLIYVPCFKVDPQSPSDLCTTGMEDSEILFITSRLILICFATRIKVPMP